MSLEPSHHRHRVWGKEQIRVRVKEERKSTATAQGERWSHRCSTPAHSKNRKDPCFGSQTSKGKRDIKNSNPNPRRKLGEEEQN